MADSERTAEAPQADLITHELDLIRSCSTEELHQQLAQALSSTAQNLIRMAAIVRELEDRGEDLSQLRLGMTRYLRKIAYGQVSPQVVVRFGEYPLLVDRVAALPTPDQERLCSGEPVRLMLLTEHGTDHRMLDPLALNRHQIAQIFDRDRLRTDAEQIAWLEGRQPRLQQDRKRPKKQRVRADPERGGIVVGRAFASLDEVLHALAELKHADYEADLEGEENVPTVIHTTAAEKQQLKVRAAKSNASMADLIRRALVAYGLIRGQADTEE